MRIIERTITEEYDETGKMTSRKTVEKYRPETETEKYARENSDSCKSVFRCTSDGKGIIEVDGKEVIRINGL